MENQENAIKQIKSKIDGLQIYINILKVAKEHHAEKSEEYLAQCNEYKALLEVFLKYIDNNLINDNYLTYFISILKNVGFAYGENIVSFSEVNQHNVESFYKNIEKRIQNETLNRLEPIKFDINTLETLYFYQNNLIFIGANGAGKTTLANDLKKHFGTNCVGISAQRVLKIPNNSSILNITDTRTKLKSIQNKDISNKLGGDISNEFQVLLNNLFSENTVTANTLKAQVRNNEELTANNSILDKVIDVWNELISHRTLSTDGMNLTLSAENIEEYTANFMSDGEKVTLYIIGQILTAPKDGFIIIDEPEIFLNKNILNKLWNKLELLRDDCKFIYLTHDLDFAINRNASKYWIKSYTKDNFDFSEIENNEIPDILVMELLGSQKNILFCEGKNDGSSYDVKILSILFPQYNIKAVESCSNVINYTKAFNQMNNLSVKAFGLIDSDFHPQERLDSLEQHSIYNFGFSEIENLCLNEQLFKDFTTSITSNENSFEVMKNKVILELSNQKVQQASLFVTMKIDYHYKESHMNKSKNLTELNDNFNTFNNPIKIDEWYNERVNEIESIVSSNNYLKAIQIFNNKGLTGQKANQSLQIANFMERMIKYLNESTIGQGYLKEYFHNDLNE